MPKTEQTKQITQTRIIKPDDPKLGEYKILTVKTLKEMLNKIDDSKHNYAIEFRNPAGDLDFAALSYFTLTVDDAQCVVTFSENEQ